MVGRLLQLSLKYLTSITLNVSWPNNKNMEINRLFNRLGWMDEMGWDGVGWIIIVIIIIYLFTVGREIVNIHKYLCTN